MMLLACVLIFASQNLEIPSHQDGIPSEIVERFLASFSDPDFLNDVGVLEHQKEEIFALNKEANERIRANLRSREFRQEALQAVADRIWQEVLLPKQQVRVMELLNREKLGNYGGSYAWFVKDNSSSVFASEHQLSETQVEQLEKLSERSKEKLEAASRKYIESIAVIMETERKAVEGTLESEQLLSFRRLFGEKALGTDEGEKFSVQALRRYLVERIRSRSEVE